LEAEVQAAKQVQAEASRLALETIEGLKAEKEALWKQFEIEKEFAVKAKAEAEAQVKAIQAFAAFTIGASNLKLTMTESKLKNAEAKDATAEATRQAAEAIGKTAENSNLQLTMAESKLKNDEAKDATAEATRQAAEAIGKTAENETEETESIQNAWDLWAHRKSLEMEYEANHPCPGEAPPFPVSTIP
jgi:hypothetical protein